MPKSHTSHIHTHISHTLCAHPSQKHITLTPTSHTHTIRPQISHPLLTHSFSHTILTHILVIHINITETTHPIVHSSSQLEKHICQVQLYTVWWAEGLGETVQIEMNIIFIKKSTILYFEWFL